MSPPLFLLCIPGIALIFLIQVLICEAYHFHVTVSHKKKSPGGPGKDKSQEGKSDKDPKDKKERQPAGGGAMRSSKDEGNPDGSPEELKDRSNSRVDFDLPEDKMGDENKSQTTVLVSLTGPIAPKDDRLRDRRKSVFAESYDPSKDDEDLVKIVNPKTPEEREWLLENVKNITLFEHLANDQTTTVVNAMYKYPVSEGDYITKQGDKGSTFYIIQTGVFEVFVKDAENVESLIHTYNNKGSFGELALLYNQPRAATIIAKTDGLLWAVDGQTFRRIVHKITYQKRMMYESLINNVPMLKALEPYERANLVDALIPMTFKHNDEIIKQGAEGDGMYFIISGGVRIIMRTINNREILLKELSNSEYFGELALVTDKPRAASAFAVGYTHLAFLDREAFERLLGPCMEVIRRHIDNYNDELLEIEKAQEQ